MKSLIQEFKAFAMKGNIIDLAVAVVIGTAFGKIISSLVDTIIMPTVGLLIGGVDFTSWAFTVGKATIAYGKFIQAIVDFTIIAFVIFMVLRVYGKFQKKEEAATVPSTPSEEALLLREIRDSVKR